MSETVFRIEVASAAAGAGGAGGPSTGGGGRRSSSDELLTDDVAFEEEVRRRFDAKLANFKVRRRVDELWQQTPEGQPVPERVPGEGGGGGGAGPNILRPLLRPLLHQLGLGHVNPFLHQLSHFGFGRGTASAAQAQAPSVPAPAPSAPIATPGPPMVSSGGNVAQIIEQTGPPNVPVGPPMVSAGGNVAQMMGPAGKAAEAAAPAAESAGLGGLSSLAGPLAAVASGLNIIHAGKKMASGYNDFTEQASGATQAALGPIIGPIIGGAMDKVATTIGNAVRAPGVVAERGANIIGEAALGNNAKALGMLYDETLKVAELWPGFGHQIALVGETAGKVVGAFSHLVDSFVKRGDELARYNANLAVAGSIRNVRGLLADIREANVLGPDLARLTDAQSRADTALREALLPIKKIIVENLATFMEKAAGALEKFQDIDIWAENLLNGFVISLAAAITGKDEHLKEDLHQIFWIIKEEVAARQRERKKTQLPWDDFFRDINAAAPQARPFPAAPPEVFGNDGAPIFKR